MAKPPTKKQKTEIKVLTQAEKDEFTELDQTVKDGMAKFVEVGQALKKIREGELYLAEFKSFTEYCASRLNMSKAQGYRLVDAVTVFENVKGIAEINPVSESQIRSLTKLKPANQKKAWKRAVKEMGDAKKLPAIQVRRIAEKIEPDHFKAKAPKPKAQPVAKDTDALWADLEQAIDKRNRKRALQLLKKLKG